MDRLPVIDLSGLKRISVDVAARTARVGGGALWGEVDRATQDHGLHVPGGRVTTTGVGGFTTGGGYGWTSSKYGLARDNPSAPAPRTSTSRTRPTGSATRTATPSTPVWWRSRTPTTQPTCSGSTRTSGPATPRRSLRWPSNWSIRAWSAAWSMRAAPRSPRAASAGADPAHARTALVMSGAPIGDPPALAVPRYAARRGFCEEVARPHRRVEGKRNTLPSTFNL